LTDTAPVQRAWDALGPQGDAQSFFLAQLLLVAIDDPSLFEDPGYPALAEHLLLVPRILHGLDPDLVRRLPSSLPWARTALAQLSARVAWGRDGVLPATLVRLAEVALRDPPFLAHFLRSTVKVVDEKP
jgi:hypothetical protein